ncbi:hypothetical protein [Candidatus Vampirococcus lugosii]|uniref:Uncharacterized protein n=1 Tax=Candidatus Vampirococcus lugosii TaxID=2789015 RepID=A0ABS5QKP3_9BACT|nr:hypothetical protein [Candidatus Vampirococcus lugosii]MBS8121762.1 hypothetical protein [Candidatus Vampirococcus lugosii]
MEENKNIQNNSIIQNKKQNKEINYKLEGEFFKGTFKKIQSKIGSIKNTKNPISWYSQIKSIKYDINELLEIISDDINQQFNINHTNKHSLLYDLGYDEVIKENIEYKYILSSKYFDDQFYFQIYSKIDPQINIFFQKLISKIYNNENKLINKYKDKQINNLNDDKNNFDKYKVLFNFLINKKLLPDQIDDKIKNNNTTKFFHEIVKKISKQENDKENLLKQLFSFFNIKKKDFNKLKYSKLVEIENIFNFDTINNNEKTLIEKQNPEILKQIDEIIYKYNYNFDFNFYLEIFDKIKNLEIRGDIWGYIKDIMKESLQENPLKNNFSTDQIIDKNTRDNKNINYRTKLTNLDPQEDKSKIRSREIMEKYDEFKKIIISLQDSYLSDSIKIFVYNFLYGNLNIKQNNFETLKIVFLYFLPKNYREYRKVYQFFEEYKKFCNMKPISSDFIKLSAFNLILIIFITFLGFYFFSIIFAFGLILFLIGYYFKNLNFSSEKFYIRWHTGVQMIGSFILTFTILNYIVISGLIKIEIAGGNISNFFEKSGNITLISYQDLNNPINIFDSQTYYSNIQANENSKSELKKFIKDNNIQNLSELVDILKN